jgi:hypothetical protein
LAHREYSLLYASGAAFAPGEMVNFPDFDATKPAGTKNAPENGIPHGNPIRREYYFFRRLSSGEGFFAKKKAPI